MIFQRKKINWKHIVTHVIAIWLLLKAGSHFTLVVHSDTLEIIADRYGYGSAHSDASIIILRMKMLIFSAWCNAITLIVATILSMYVSFRNNWFWLNSLLAVIGILLLWSFFHFNPLTAIFGYRNELIDSIFIQHLLFTLIYMALGLLLFFLPAIKRWVNTEYKAEDIEPEFQFEEIPRQNNHMG